jgi:hypothetical protein
MFRQDAAKMVSGAAASRLDYRAVRLSRPFASHPLLAPTAASLLTTAGCARPARFPELGFAVGFGRSASALVWKNEITSVTF